MRIERIDEKTVKCYLSNEEMAEHEITYKDFVTRSQKAKNMVEQIIAQAVEEVGYKPPEFAMDMQIMLMPEQGMVLTLSEKTPEEIANNPTLMEYLREMKKAFQQKLAEGMTPEQIQENMAQLGEGLPGAAAAAGNAPTAEDGQGMPEIAVFAFDSLKAVCDYVNVLPKILRVNSSLYLEKGIYYLYMEKGTSAYKRYSRACILALEYGRLYGASMDKVTYLQEHAECLIEEKAVQKLRL